MDKFLSIFQSGEGSLSCKRVCGLVGWLVILYCAVASVDVPFMDALIAATVVLLGVETVTNIFKQNGDKDRQSVEA